MAENKTVPTKGSVNAFLENIKDKQVRDDCLAIVEMMQKISNTKPVMWGSAIVGFGKYHYVYESGREGDSPLIGFSPRKQNITLYLMSGMDKIEDELSKLGKHKTAGGCLYIKSLGDVNVSVLKKILVKAYKESKKAHAA